MKESNSIQADEDDMKVWDSQATNENELLYLDDEQMAKLQFAADQHESDFAYFLVE